MKNFWRGIYAEASQQLGIDTFEEVERRISVVLRRLTRAGRKAEMGEILRYIPHGSSWMRENGHLLVIAIAYRQGYTVDFSIKEVEDEEDHGKGS